MRIGLLARADATGLGYQTRDYYKHLKPSKTMLIDISGDTGTAQNYDWYPDAMRVVGFPRRSDVEEFLTDIDVLLTAETAYNFEFYSIARQRGIKTVCVENPEFYDHIIYPELPMPDLIILPSIWMMDQIRNHAEGRGTKVIQLHHPVDRADFPFRLRDHHQDIHIAGKPAANDRNGTWDYLEARPNGTIVTQSRELAGQIGQRYRHSTVFYNVDDPNYMYQLGDFLVLPRRYGGNCLVLNEALSSGMPVIMPRISPNTNLLPDEWLVSAFVSSTFEPRTKVDVHHTNIDELAHKIQWMSENVTEQSKIADQIADTISWATLKPKYTEALEQLCQS